MSVRRTLVCALALLAAATAALAAGPVGPTATEDRIERLDRRLASVEAALEASWIWRGRLVDLQETVGRVVETAAGIGDRQRAQAARQKELLDSLGPPPVEGEAESSEVALQRSTLRNRFSEVQGYAKQADLLVAKGRDLRQQIVASIDRLEARNLLFRGKAIWSTVLWASAASEVRAAYQYFTEGGAAGSRDGPTSTASPALPALVLSVFVVLLAWLPLRVGLARRLEVPSRADAKESEPSHIAAFRRLLIRYLLPAALIYSGLYLAREGGHLDALRASVFAEAVLVYIGVFVVASLIANARSELSARYSGERLLHLERPLVVLVTLCGLSFFLSSASETSASIPAVLEVIEFVIRVVTAFVIGILLVRGVLALVPAYAFRSTEGRRRLRRTRGVWVLVETAAVLGALVGLGSPVVMAVGYRNLADWLFFNTAATFCIFVLGRFASGVVHDAAPAFSRRVLRPAVAAVFGRILPRRRLELFEFWFKAMADAGLWLGAAAFVSMAWGFEWMRAAEWLEIALEGVTVGGVDISLRNISFAIGMFLVFYLATRLAQKGLEDRVFPKTRLDLGARNAIKSGLGYIGITIAVLAAIGGLGIGLSKLALIAGALSVGIGFGLQAIANNFVSGIIMLVERPIKVGDWVVVNDHEGMVKRISVRAIELQTFQRASILIPNSEIISGTVTNWTFKDLTGRVDVTLGIDYEADIDRVSDLLVDCARRHPKVLGNPAPRTVVREFGDFAVTLELWAYITIFAVTDRILTESDLRRDILRSLRSEGISIPYPQYDVRLASGRFVEAAD